MSDQRLRDLERRFLETGAAGDRRAWLRERARTGDVEARFELLLDVIARVKERRPELACFVEDLGLLAQIRARMLAGSAETAAIRFATVVYMKRYATLPKAFGIDVRQRLNAWCDEVLLELERSNG